LSAFLVICGALVLLSGLFYLIPRQRPGTVDADLERANLEWFRLRQSELAQEGNEALQADARLRLLEDEQQVAAAPTETPAAGRRFPLWLLLPLVAVASAGLYYQLGAAADVAIARQLQSLDENTTAEQMDELMQRIESRAAQRPDNLHYTALLGRYYMGQQEYASAATTYEALAQQAPEDAQALAYAAQARYLAAGRSLSDDARLRAEQALAIDPHQRTALGLLGMASFEQGNYRAAVEYWQRLLVMETPGSESARMIAGVIESARQNLGEGPEVVETPSGAGGAGVSVHVALPDGASVNPGDTVFVLARNADSDSRMPIAVQRLQAAQLPVTLRLDDSNSMAGQKLSETPSVVVLVQVSPDGRPGEANATWMGRAGPLAPGTDSEPLAIVLSPRES
jgi:cytochrome c-type biogenesis protein CcmH